jgi:hypothetical protein
MTKFISMHTPLEWITRYGQGFSFPDVFMMSSCKSLDMFSYIVIYVQLCSVTVNLQSLRVEHSAASAERCFRISAAFSMGSSEGQGKTREDKWWQWGEAQNKSLGSASFRSSGGNRISLASETAWRHRKASRDWLTYTCDYMCTWF